MPIYNLVYGIQTTPPTPPEPWTPGANTIAYYPLNSTYNFTDQSGNGYDLTTSNATITSLNGISCASYSNGRAYNSTPSVGSQRTLSARFYNCTNGVMVGTGANQSTFQCIMLAKASGQTIQISDFHSIGFASGNISSNTRHHAVAVASGANMYLYVDGVLATGGTHSRTDGSTGVSAGGKPFLDINPDQYSGYLSNVIIESVAWSAQDVADYYNLTKSDYGIS